MSYKGKRFRRDQHVMSDINVTPFVDVMLVLLIIFMVVAPLAKYGMEIKLPSAQAGSIAKEEKWAITLYRNREIHFNDKKIKLDDLEKKLRELAVANRNVEVFLKADEALPYGFVVEVMATARRSGVLNLGMITEPLTVVQ